MKYSGIDLHSNNSVVTVTDEEDRVIAEKRLPNDLAKIVGFLQPWRDELAAVVVESTYNWYWLVDGLQEAGFVVKLANTGAIKEYDGLKHSGDEADARQLAHLLRLCKEKGTGVDFFFIHASNPHKTIRLRYLWLVFGYPSDIKREADVYYVCQRTMRLGRKGYNYIIDGRFQNRLILCRTEKAGMKICNRYEEGTPTLRSAVHSLKTQYLHGVSSYFISTKTF